MKSFLGLLVVVLSLCISCSRKNSLGSAVGLVGTWELHESYADIGDGSGSYRPVASDRVIVFRPDGSFLTNGSFCPGQEGGGHSGGTYLLPEWRLTPDCENAEDLPFTLQNDTLQITFHCIEGCGERYVRVSDATEL